MNVDPWAREFEVAVQAVRDGAFLARQVRERSGDRAWLKLDQSPVTVADFAVQALVAHRLCETFPGDPLVAEEDAAALRAPSGQPTTELVRTALQDTVPGVDSMLVLDLIDRGRGAPGDRFWTLDPVDGTRGFVRGDQYVRRARADCPRPGGHRCDRLSGAGANRSACRSDGMDGVRHSWRRRIRSFIA